MNRCITDMNEGMDIAKNLSSEHSKPMTMAIVRYVGSDANKFSGLMQLVLGNDSVLSQRASWPMGYLLIEHPALARPYFKRLVAKLSEADVHPAVKRNVLRALQEMEIPETYQGELVDSCFGLIRNESQPAGIRAFAITTAFNICRMYPELSRELLLLLNGLNEVPQQPAIKVRVKLALKELQRL